jgi:DDE superfamily endonuclease
VLLILDNFSAHAAGSQYLQANEPLRNTEIIYLPPNVTSRHQPLDQGVIRAWKAHWKRKWLQYMIDEFDEGREPIKSMDILKAVRWGIDSWHHDVSLSAIENCWIKSGLLGPRFGPVTRPRDYREAPHGARQEVPETETLEQIERSISTLIERVAADRGIQEIISTEDFLSPIGERVEDSSDDIEQQRF